MGKDLHREYREHRFSTRLAIIHTQRQVGGLQAPPDICDVDKVRASLAGYLVEKLVLPLQACLTQEEVWI
jgi:hypothetical protein